MSTNIPEIIIKNQEDSKVVPTEEIKNLSITDNIPTTTNVVDEEEKKVNQKLKKAVVNRSNEFNNYVNKIFKCKLNCFTNKYFYNGPSRIEINIPYNNAVKDVFGYEISYVQNMRNSDIIFLFLELLPLIIANMIHKIYHSNTDNKHYYLIGAFLEFYRITSQEKIGKNDTVFK